MATISSSKRKQRLRQRLLAILGRGKWDIVAALRLREAEERRRIVQWVNDHFASSPPGVCAHCGDGPRSEDPFVLSVRRKRSGRGARLMSFGVAGASERPRRAVRSGLGSVQRRGSRWRQTQRPVHNDAPPHRKTNDMTAALADLRRMPHKRRPATRAGTPKKEGHSRDSASGPRTAPTGLQSQQ